MNDIRLEMTLRCVDVIDDDDDDVVVVVVVVAENNKMAGSR